MSSQGSCFHLSKIEVETRKKFRNWLRKNLPGESERSLWFTDDLNARYASWGRWQKKMYEGGWMGLSWPVEYGGKGLSNICEFIIGEELAIHRAPFSGNWISLAAIAQGLLSFGTHEQKIKYLPLIAKGESSWCLGVTEPDSGSNVMNTSTTAVLDGDEFVINGRKIWTTHSPRAENCLLLVKTGTHEKVEWNLSTIIVKLNTPGVTIIPLRQLHGEDNYGEVIYNNVRVPKENLVGSVNGGWIVQATTWLQESIPPFDIPHRLGLRTLMSDFRNSKKKNNPVCAADFAKIAIESELVRLTTVRALRIQNESSGLFLPATSTVIKVIFTEATQKITQAGLDWSSEDNKILAATKPVNWMYRHISARSNTIARAPSEIHRNFISRHFLGLPK